MTGPRVLPEYYGPEGADIAGAFRRRDERKRQSAIDTRTAAESDLRIKGETYRQKHQQEIDPLEDAIRRALARERGIMGPGEQPQPTGPAGQQGLPPAQAPAQRPPSGGHMDFGGAPDQAGGAPAMGPDIYDMTPVQGTAHALPGAFNPTTGTHNPADVDLGGGYRLSGAQTPEGRRSRDASELAAAKIPGITPELAMYLSDHPEHIAPFIQRAYRPAGSRWEPSSEDEALDYEGKLAALRRKDSVQQRGELTLEQALAQVDEMYGTRDPVTGGITAHRLSPRNRLQTARRIMQGDYSGLGATGKFGTAPPDRGQPGPTSPRHITKDQQAYLQHTGKWDPARYIVDPN